MMSRARKTIVGVVAMVSLLGTGGLVQALTPDSPDVASANVWCC